MTPCVSVVMPVRNGELFLAEAVESILGQTLTELELVVVDDGSTDGTPAILARYQGSDDRVRVVTQEARGLAPALNAGCAVATARYVARMDADDVSLPDRLERQLRFLDEHPEVALLGGAYVAVSADLRPLVTVRYPTRHGRIVQALLHYNCFAHPTVVVRRDAFQAVGGYRLRNAEDYDLWLRLAERYRVANLHEPVLLYRQHPEQFSEASLRAQALGALIVRAAARARRAGRQDPLAEGAEPASSSLHIDDAALEEALATDYARRAELAAAAGGAAAADRVLDRAHLRQSRRSLQCRLRLLQARTAVRQRRPLRVLGSGARALALDPRLALRALVLRAARR